MTNALFLECNFVPPSLAVVDGMGILDTTGVGILLEQKAESGSY